MNEIMKKQPSVNIKFEGGKVHIFWNFLTAAKKKDDGGFACYIPAFDIYFSATDKETLDKKSITLTKLYFDYFMNEPRKGFKNLILDLHKLGFKTKHDAFTIKQLLNNIHINSKFKSCGEIPPSFKDALVEENESEMAIEVA